MDRYRVIPWADGKHWDVMNTRLWHSHIYTSEQLAQKECVRVNAILIAKEDK